MPQRPDRNAGSPVPSVNGHTNGYHSSNGISNGYSAIHGNGSSKPRIYDGPMTLRRTVTKFPPQVKPFVYHGVDAEIQEGSTQARARCPFCAHDDRKFYVAIDTSKSDCKNCGWTGNVYGFLRTLHERGMEATSDADYAALAVSRNLLFPDTPKRWGVCRNTLTGEWIFPGYNDAGALCQLYVWQDVMTKEGVKRIVNCCGGGGGEADPEGVLRHQFSHAKDFDPKRPTYYCEGWGDGMVLWELVGKCGRANVIAVPGANVFKPSWGTILKGCPDVYFAYDNDHPRRLGTTEPPRYARTGLDGMKRCAGIVAKQLLPYERPAVHYLRWGKEGHNAALPDGFDLRDWFKQAPTYKQRMNLLEELQKRFVPVPSDWLTTSAHPSSAQNGSPSSNGRQAHGRGPGGARNGAYNGYSAIHGNSGKSGEGAQSVARKSIIPLIPCTSYETVLAAWKDAMEWDWGMDVTLAAMFATCASTGQVGDQVWLRVVSAPSTGKTTLCDGFDSAPEYIHSESTFTGFFSGYKTDTRGDEDHSLVSFLKDKTFVVKDADPFLKAPNRDQLMSEARDLYDRRGSKRYRHALAREFAGSFTWILCGTPAIREMDTSELGERMLTVSMMNEISAAHEWNVCKRATGSIISNLGCMVNCQPETKDTKEKIRAKGLTGGYCAYLRQNAPQLLKQVTWSTEANEMCIRLAQFIAYMRCRQSKKQDEIVSREFAPRLSVQMTILASCLAITTGSREIKLDSDPMKRIRKVATDSSIGKNLDLARTISQSGAEGFSVGQIETMQPRNGDKLTSELSFMAKIGIIEKREIRSGMRRDTKWRLTEDMAALFKHLGL